jgi:type IV pilus assembly protein PilM
VAGETRELTVAGRGIGVDVGSHSVKIAVVRRQLGGLVLEHIAEQPVARASAGRPPAEAIAAALAAAVDGITIGRAVVAVGVPTQLATVRNLDIPFSDERRIRQVLKAEVEPHIPFAAEDIVVDYCHTGVAREAPGGDEAAPTPTNLLITAVQKNVVGETLSLLQFDESLGEVEPIDPEVTEVEFMGAFSAVRTLAPETSEGGELVVDVGAVKTSVVYARGGRPLAVRSINVGGDALARAVADATGTSFAEAEQQMRAYTIPAGEAEPETPVARAFAGALGAFRRGLDQTLRFFGSQVGEVGYERVVLTGGAAALGGLREWLGSVLAKEVVVLDSLGPVKNAAGDAVAVARDATAIGLALRGIGESVSLHNFRQEELAYPNPLKRLAKFLAPAVALIVALVVAAIAGYFISYRTTLAEARQYRRAVERELADIPGVAGRYDVLAAATDEIRERRAELDSLVRQNPRSVLDVLYEISMICFDKKIPEKDPASFTDKEEAIKDLIERSGDWKVQITSLHMQQNRVDVEGTAATYSAINQLKRAFAASPLFPEVRMGSSAPRAGRVTFKMTLYLEKQPEIR